MKTMSSVLTAALIVIVDVTFVPANDVTVQNDIFLSGKEGYHTYRIPALITTSKGTLLAFCEGRRFSREDLGNNDLLLRRSSDGGSRLARKY